MFVGWWWLYCTLVTVVYRSSLIAHLSVPGTSVTIDTLQQLQEADGWTWGYEPSYGAGWEWFKMNTNPIIKRIFEGMEVMEFPEQMERVLKGRHALITWKYKIKSLVAALYTDEYGNTPIYTAKQVYFNYGGYGWCFRKGAPFHRAIDLQKQRMIEAGLIPQWIDDLVGTKAMKAREQFAATTTTEDWAKNLQQNSESGRVVLSLLHLQSVFLLLLLGFGIGLAGLFIEVVGHACTKKAEGKVPVVTNMEVKASR